MLAGNGGATFVRNTIARWPNDRTTNVAFGAVRAEYPYDRKPRIPARLVGGDDRSAALRHFLSPIAGPSIRYRTGEKRPPDARLRRKDRRARTAESRPRTVGQRAVATPPRRAHAGPQSIVGGDPHTRLQLREPATPNRARQGPEGRRGCGRPLHGAVPARLAGRRFGGMGTPPSSR